ncbi:MAG: carbon-nitrogen hydrolase family protein [Lewinellaceae bacterium]|nr:carbon-nitrogen hydrolase family protein [Lewinellaceae bacterium]
MRIATSQFPISASIDQNRMYILRQMVEASAQNCQVIHFPEGSLSGYAGVDFPTFQGFDWSLLREATEAIMAEAGRLGIWVILGSAHPLTHPNKPHNSLYIINARGQLVDRYDKRFCAGDNSGNSGDLAHYSSGNYTPVFSIDGIRCSTLICHDYRYPELYRDLATRKVEVVFHSYHAGNMDPARRQFMESQIGKQYHNINPGRTYPEITMPATMISYAANNYCWISCSNTSAKASCWASFIVRPDGVIVGKLPKNQAGILVTEIDPAEKYYDSTQHWRQNAIRGILHSGHLARDSRSNLRQEL